MHNGRWKVWGLGFCLVAGCDEPNPESYSLTFWVDVGSGQASEMYVETQQSDTDEWVRTELFDPNADGVFVGGIEVLAGEEVFYHFVKVEGGLETRESVPYECGVERQGTFSRTVAMGDEDVELPTAYFSGCDTPWEETLCGHLPGLDTRVSVVGTQVLRGDTPIHMKGVAWSPVALGQVPWTHGADFLGTVDEDAALMADAGINVVRTYGPITDMEVLDVLWDHGISVMMTVFYGYDETALSATTQMCALKSHPAIMGWVVGNEWNYNNLGRSVSLSEATSAVQEVVDELLLNDKTRPVMTVYGGLPDAQTLTQLSNVSIWGTNIYPGDSFGGLFAGWAGRSSKPLVVAEYGSDAWDARINAENEEMQARFVTSLTEELFDHSSIYPDGVCAGGFVFEFNDEWWKYGSGNPGVHDTASSWQNGTYPDPDIHEEWWGLVRLDRTPREAYYAYGNLDAPTAE